MDCDRSMRPSRSVLRIHEARKPGTPGSTASLRSPQTLPSEMPRVILTLNFDFNSTNPTLSTDCTMWLSRCVRSACVSNVGSRGHMSVARHLHTTGRYLTDGVFPALTEMRVKTPWIEALRRQREEGNDPAKRSSTSATPNDRDLSPKKMSDSYHRVVRSHSGNPQTQLTE